VKDTINCPKGNNTTVYADTSDYTKGCAHVIYTPDPNPTFRMRNFTHRSAHRSKHHTTKSKQRF